MKKTIILTSLLLLLVSFASGLTLTKVWYDNFQDASGLNLSLWNNTFQHTAGGTAGCIIQSGTVYCPDGRGAKTYQISSLSDWNGSQYFEITWGQRNFGIQSSWELTTFDPAKGYVCSDNGYFDLNCSSQGRLGVYYQSYNRNYQILFPDGYVYPINMNFAGSGYATFRYNSSGYYLWKVIGYGSFNYRYSNLVVYHNDTTSYPFDYIAIGNWANNSAQHDYGLEADFSINQLCEENWQPQYSECDIDDTLVLTYIDLNNCGSTNGLPVDNGTIYDCDYCTLQYHNETSDCLPNNIKIVYPIYDNFETCCNITNITEDCQLPLNGTVPCVGIHSTNDITGLVIDFGVEYGITLIALVGLIAIAGLYIVIKKVK